MTNVSKVFEKVSAGEMTPEQGTAELMAARESKPSRPSWLPRPLYFVGMFILAIVVPNLISRSNG
jgi:hypothetical protein